MFLRDPDDSILYIFFDPNQAIYQKDYYFPIKEDPFPLTNNCRNTKHIHEIAYHYFQGHPTSPPPIEGRPIGTITAPSTQAQFHKLNSFITNLISKEGVVASDIAILITGRPKTHYYKLLEGLNLPKGNVYSVEDQNRTNALIIDTVRRFKGLEAPIIFLWGLDTIDPNEQKELLYIGFSRAKSLLYLVGTNETCERYQNIQ